MGNLIFYRDKHNYLHSFRTIDVYLENKLITSIDRNDRFTVSLPKGEYSVFFKIDWVKSKKYKINIIQENESVEFRIDFFKSIKNKNIFLLYFLEAIVLIPVLTLFFSDFGFLLKILGSLYILSVLYRITHIVLYSFIW